ncbi:MAG: hypothetical protein VKJ04_06910 [Vampirovibrionales bacterium]|nr:hypothetical protein [Vampirovibrionales bacterium]
MALAHPTIFFSRLGDFLKRNNPLIMILFSIVQSIYLLVTWQSRVKIMKYKLLLEVERLERMQNALYNDPIHQSQMGKMNRVY